MSSRKFLGLVMITFPVGEDENPYQVLREFMTGLTVLSGEDVRWKRINGPSGQPCSPYEIKADSDEAMWKELGQLRFNLVEAENEREEDYEIAG